MNPSQRKIHFYNWGRNQIAVIICSINHLTSNSESIQNMTYSYYCIQNQFAEIPRIRTSWKKIKFLSGITLLFISPCKMKNSEKKKFWNLQDFALLNIYIYPMNQKTFISWVFWLSKTSNGNMYIFLQIQCCFVRIWFINTFLRFSIIEQHSIADDLVLRLDKSLNLAIFW